jgi:ferredoxin--NADP+ reductase
VSDSASEFVGWYNGHPDCAALDPDLSGRRAVIVGNGNVALDVARVLLSDAATLATTDIPVSARARLDAAGSRRSSSWVGAVRRKPQQPPPN